VKSVSAGKSYEKFYSNRMQLIDSKKNSRCNL